MLDVQPTARSSSGPTKVKAKRPKKISIHVRMRRSDVSRRSNSSMQVVSLQTRGSAFKSTGHWQILQCACGGMLDPVRGMLWLAGLARALAALASTM